MTNGAAGIFVPTERAELEARRPCIAQVLEWGGLKFLVRFGYDRDGACREIFITLIGVPGAAPEIAPSVGLATLVHQAAILASHLLQRGARVAELADTLRHFGDPGVAPATQGLLQAVLERASDAEIGDRPSVMLAYQCWDQARAKP